MCNFAPEVDVIWGVAFDETLGEKVKVTILASGFNVTLNNEVSPKKPSAGKQVFVEPSPDDNTRRLMDEYGQDKIMAQAQDAAKARYMVLTLDDYDNDEVVDLIERTPTFGRDQRFRETIKSVISNAQETSNIPPTIPAINKSSQSTISFVE